VETEFIHKRLHSGFSCFTRVRHSINPYVPKNTSSFVISYCVTKYAQCPFCDALFKEPQARKASGSTQLEEHVMTMHRKVRVRKGSNYRWMDEAEVKKTAAREGIGPMKRGRGE